MEAKIIEIIKKRHPTYDELISNFNVEKNIIIEILLSLEQDGKIDKVKNKYYLTKELNLISACITSIKEKFAFASVSEDEDCYIRIENLKNAFLNDCVLIKKISVYNQKDEYEVIKVTKRARTEIVGEICSLKNEKCVLVDKIARAGFLFLIRENSTFVNGQIVRAKIKKIASNFADVEVIEVLGNKLDVGMDVTRIILSNNAPLNFPDEVIEAAQNLPNKVSEEELKNREDYRDHLIVTIDGEDAKDFDDAVEVCKIEDIYYVGVHIADVAHYVKENSIIDLEALNRSTSLYVRDRVVPMLPFNLSNGICSLNPHEDRLVTSVLFAIDETGKLCSSYITKGVINSKHRLTYSFVNEFLNEKRYQKTEYSDLEEMLIHLQEVANLIRKKRRKQGGIELSSTELIFDIDKEGNPTEVKKRKQDVGENLIEDLMIKANEIVASTIEKENLPMVYRIHEKPRVKKLESFKSITATQGYPLNVDSLNCTPLEVANYLSSLPEEEKDVLSNLLLKCLAKAKYSTDNKYHFGLASKSYTHFTSPIRRYPDLMVHRLIDKYLISKNKKCNQEEKDQLIKNCQLCSTRERRAITIERSVIDLLSCKYMVDKVGNEYQARIVSFVAQGMFVETDEGIQGFIPFESVLEDFYIFDEVIYRAYGVRKGKEYKLGQVLKVICMNIDMDRYRVIFNLSETLKTHKMKNKGRRAYGKKRK